DREHRVARAEPRRIARNLRDRSGGGRRARLARAADGRPQGAAAAGGARRRRDGGRGLRNSLKRRGTGRRWGRTAAGLAVTQSAGREHPPIPSIVPARGLAANWRLHNMQHDPTNLQVVTKKSSRWPRNLLCIATLCQFCPKSCLESGVAPKGKRITCWLNND